MSFHKKIRLSQKLIPIFYLLLSFLSCEAFGEPEVEVDKFNQIIGTQVFAPLYGCGGECTVVEAAHNISELGSRIIKMRTTDPEALKEILNMPFDTYFFWWRSNGDTWFNGFSKEARKVEYDETYKFAKNLLTQFKDTEKRFFIGNWEGDWYLLQKQSNGKTTEPTQANADNMAAWLNTRQQAIDDARKDFPSKSKIYFYAEVNRVLDATQDKKLRMANAVLHQTNVDYVSYSSYDVQNQSQDVINSTLDYLQSQLKPKAGITGKRVFIGEMGMQARVFNGDEKKDDQKNREIMLKFLKWKTPYILYWQIYNNEVNNGKQEGFWLIDNLDHKWLLWYTLYDLYNIQKNEVMHSGDGSYDFVNQKTIEYLGNR